MSLIRVYLDNQPPSDDNVEVKRIAHKSRMYHLIDGYYIDMVLMG
jgi:hypothetical protein